MFLVNTLKRNLHRAIAESPVLHGLVLNLYLNGEQYPHRVDDYFQLAAVEDASLAATMRSHMRDEDRHVALYRKAIATLGEPIVELPLDEIYNEVIRKHSKTPFAIAPDETRDAKTLKLAHFFAHLHFLEKRIANSLVYHLDGCAHSPCAYVAKAVGAVLNDEGRHVMYTREAVENLLPKRVAQSVLGWHKRAERRANVEFSATQLRQLVASHGQHFGVANRVLYGGCSSLLGKLVFNA